MTDDKKHDDKDRKKLSDEEMEDVAGGGNKVKLHHGSKGISHPDIEQETELRRGPDGDGKLSDAEKG
jgi:hypothetical protein